MKQIVQHCASALQSKVSESDFMLIKSGYSDAIKYHLSTNNKDYFVKVFPESQSLKQRKNEIKAYELHSKRWIAPQLIFSRDEILIAEYIWGKHLNWDDYHQEEVLEKLMTVLKEIHLSEIAGIQVTLSSIQKSQKIVSELERAHFPIPLVLKNQFEHLFQMKAILSRQTVIHNDFNCSNIFYTKNKNLRVVDWTESGLGEPFEDLAEIAIFYPYDKHSMLLSMYQGNYTEAELQHFNLIYKRRVLWFALWSYLHAFKLEPCDLSQQWQSIFESNTKDFHTVIKCVSKGLMSIKSTYDFLFFSAVCFQHIIN